MAFFSRLIDASKVTAFMVLTATATGSPAAVGILALCATAPVILLGPSIGVQIDRRSPSKMLVVGLASQVVVAAGLALLAGAGLAGVPVLVGAALILGTCQAVSDNCLNVILPHVTDSDRLLRANGIMSTGQSMARIIGPMAGSALAVLAPGSLFVAWAVLSAALCCVVVARVGGTSAQVGHGDSRPSWRDGFVWIAGSGPTRRLLIAVTLNNMAYGSMAAVLPILAMQSLGLPPATYGVVASTTSLAALFGSMLATVAGPRATLMRVSMASLVVQLGGFSALAFAWSAPSLFVAVGILGLSTGAWNVASSTRLMAIVPAEVRGRVMAAYRSVAFAGSPAGNVVGGATGEGWLRVPLYAAACAAAVALVVFAREPRGRSADEER
ncbi:MFS transporter [Cellulomonas bogoriensis]|uniref:Major facilitator superfamily (MFS) profile domain-containing protein n=1 Tax=Cellulomonas bogoriensis 69B4 = DSM 16987 TaxID=1386082 RepID=A0A0A0C4I6_9CELL|nr:MFS transporter [Cellulomonas bogoriensis]KGM14229.1 hypothetical protein N869_01305 [Cellulomonas bogoriensis 69B4 = DSM 16987]